MVSAKGPEAVDFFDDDDAEQPPPRRGGPGGSGGSPRGGHPPATRQQMRARQAALAVGAIVMLILIVIAFRGCLDARKDRAFQNYVNDLSSITSETDQLSQQFFGRLTGDDSAQVGGLDFEAEVNSDLGTSQGLLDRAANLDAPGEVKEAQNLIEISYELRHDALEGVSAQLGKLGGSADVAKDANDVIYTQMKVLSASDILYARARDQIEQSLKDEEVVVEDGVPDSQFLPDPDKNFDFLNPDDVAAAFSSVGTGSGDALAGAAGANCDPGDNGVHGMAIVSAIGLPSGVALDPNTTVAATGDTEIQVDVQNGGDSEETGVDVTVSGDGITGSETIDKIASQEVQSIPIKLDPAPKSGETVSLDVEVATVCGEKIADNNKATYSVTF
jgi:hypothetical protein